MASQRAPRSFYQDRFSHEWRNAFEGKISGNVIDGRHAPDLLDALTRLYNATKDVGIGRYDELMHDIAVSKARAAIAKAMTT